LYLLGIVDMLAITPAVGDTPEGVKTTRLGVLEAGVLRILKKSARRDSGPAQCGSVLQLRVAAKGSASPIALFRYSRGVLTEPAAKAIRS
jgi:hypothetical protein